MIDRRNFLRAILVAAAGPMIVRASSLMPIRALEPDAAPAIWLGLFTEHGVEVAGGSYARVAIKAAAGQQAVIFPTASTHWGTVTAWGRFDAAQDGNFLLEGSIGDPLDIDVGSTVAWWGKK